MGIKPPENPIYFRSSDELREWFDANHETATELWIGYHRKATGRPSLTWSETVDESLCVGWIDSVRYSADGGRFVQRLTPRQKRSNWSAVNIAKVKQLFDEGRMRPAGLAAFEARSEARSGIYSYEQRTEAAFEPDQEARFLGNEAAWAWFETRPASYRTAAVYWVVSAKRPETREKRLATLIEDSAAKRPVKHLAPRTRPG